MLTSHLSRFRAENRLFSSDAFLPKGHDQSHEERAALPCLACLAAAAFNFCFRPNLRVVVVRVTDGDTIVIQSCEEQYKIRLSGIDAPEIRQAIGREARPALAGQVKGKAVVIIWEKKDRYSLLLGTVLLGSVNVNLEQMRGRFA